MEIPSKLLEQIAFNTRPKTEEHMLMVMDKSTHKEHLAQQVQTTNKQFKIAVTFLSAFNCIFNVTNSKNKFHFIKSITETVGYIQIIIPPGAYEIESLNNEIRMIIIQEKLYTEVDYPFLIKPNFSTLGSIIEISTQGPAFTFVPDNSVGDLLGFNKTTIYEEYNLSPNHVDFLNFVIIFLECDISQGMIFRPKRSGIIHNFTMDVDPGYKYREKFSGGISWHMMQSKKHYFKYLFQIKK